MVSPVREPAGMRLSRLLSLVPWLEQHDGVSLTEAAEHFGVSAQELERDLWLTVCCGLPGHGPDQLVDIQFWDEDGSIHVIDPQTLDRPLRFSPAEAMSLLVGLRVLAQVPGSHDRAALASVTAKLESAIDVAHGDAVVVAATDDSHVSELLTAIDAGCAVRLVYAGASRDEVTDRVVEPGSVVSHAGHTYLTAWCRRAGAQRTFRLDRVVSVQVLDEPVAAAPADPQVTPADGTPVRLRFAARSRWLLEFLETSDPIDLGEGSQEVTIAVAEPDWLVRMVLGQGGGVEVLEPAALRLQVRGAAERALGRLDEAVIA
jgi:predicted DNA-binding transcriptional regulator YafY